MESTPKYTPLDVMGIVVIAANCPFIRLFQNLK
jgi:hypothetical protein